MAEFVLDELVEPEKSPNASNTLLPEVDAGDGTAKASSGDGCAALGEPNASNGEAFCLAGAEGAAAVMSLKGSREAAELARLPARLVGVGASKALNGDEAAGAG